MDGITIIGIAFILWGLATVSIALFKPKAIWKMGKIQGFVQILSETSTVIFFIIVGAIAIGAGIFILL